MDKQISPESLFQQLARDLSRPMDKQTSAGSTGSRDSQGRHVSFKQQISHEKTTNRGTDRMYNSKVADQISAAFNKIADMALVIDAAHCTEADLPIASVSAGFCRTTGYTSSDFVGVSLVALFEKGPVEMISKSGRKNLLDYCLSCSSREVGHIAETTVEQPVVCHDGSHFMGMFLAGLCEYRCRAYILVVVNEKAQQKGKEQHEALREAFLRIRSGLNGYDKQHKFLSQSSFGSSNVGTPFPSWHGSENAIVVAKEKAFKSRRPRMEHRWSRRGHRRAKALERMAAAQLPDFAFFAQRLDLSCVLGSEGYTATRRESSELQKGCLGYSDSSMKLRPEGFEFSVRVDGVEPQWMGLPILGFTRRKPADNPDLYPSMGMYQGQSVLVGMEGKAFARDQYPHFVMGFKRPNQEQLRVWKPEAEFDCPQLSVGDILRCVYTREGRIQLWLNSEKIIDFDSERQIDPSVDYYAVVDVCFNASSLTVLPSLACTSTLVSTPANPPKNGAGHEDNDRVPLPPPRINSAASAVSTLDSLPSLDFSDNASAMSDESPTHHPVVQSIDGQGGFNLPLQTDAVQPQTPISTEYSAEANTSHDKGYTACAPRGHVQEPSLAAPAPLLDSSCTIQQRNEGFNESPYTGSCVEVAGSKEDLVRTQNPNIVGDLLVSFSRDAEGRPSWALCGAIAVAILSSVGLCLCSARRAPKMT